MWGFHLMLSGPKASEPGYLVPISGEGPAVTGQPPAQFGLHGNRCQQSSLALGFSQGAGARGQPVS